MPKLSPFQLRTLRGFLAEEAQYCYVCKDGFVSAASFRSPTILALARLGLLETRAVSYTYYGGLRERGRLRYASEILARSTEAGRAVAVGKEL